MDESPRWLISKNRYKEAFNVVFKKSTKPIVERHNSIVRTQPLLVEENSMKKSVKSKMTAAMHEILALYSNRFIRNRLLICQFAWFVVSFAYYAIALNGENIDVSTYSYILIMGIFEIPSCFLTIGILKLFGRKSTSIMLFVLSGISLLALLVFPQGKNLICVTCKHERWVAYLTFVWQKVTYAQEHYYHHDAHPSSKCDACHS